MTTQPRAAILRTPEQVAHDDALIADAVRIIHSTLTPDRPVDKPFDLGQALIAANRGDVPDRIDMLIALLAELLRDAHDQYEVPNSGYPYWARPFLKAFRVMQEHPDDLTADELEILGNLEATEPGMPTRRLRELTNGDAIRIARLGAAGATKLADWYESTERDADAIAEMEDHLDEPAGGVES